MFSTIQQARKQPHASAGAGGRVVKAPMVPHQQQHQQGRKPVSALDVANQMRIHAAADASRGGRQNRMDERRQQNQQRRQPQVQQQQQGGRPQGNRGMAAMDIAEQLKKRKQQSLLKAAVMAVMESKAGGGRRGRKNDGAMGVKAAKSISALVAGGGVKVAKGGAKGGVKEARVKLPQVKRVRKAKESRPELSRDQLLDMITEHTGAMA